MNSFFNNYKGHIFMMVFKWMFLITGFLRTFDYNNKFVNNHYF